VEQPDPQPSSQLPGPDIGRALAGMGLSVFSCALDADGWDAAALEARAAAARAVFAAAGGEPGAPHPEDLARVEEALACAARGEPAEVEYRVDVGGVTCWLCERLHPRPVEHGSPVVVDGILEDVSGRRELERQLRTADAEHAIVGRVARLVAEGPPLRLLAQRVAEEAAAWVGCDEAALWRFVEGGARCVGAGWAADARRALAAGDVVLLDGDSILTRILATGLQARIDDVGSDGTPIASFLQRTARRSAVGSPVRVDGAIWGALVVASDPVDALDRDAELRLGRLTELIELAIANADAREQLARQADTDALTGVANRRSFERALAGEVERSQASGRPLSFVLVDLDHFKRFNDTYGHLAGDAALIQVARLMTETSREGNLIARVGGEEFAWLLPDTTETEALEAVERLRRQLQDEPIDGVGLVTLSAGITQLAEGGTALELYSYADTALYAAKRLGRNRCRVFSQLDELELEAVEPEPVRAAYVLMLTSSVSAREQRLPLHSERVSELAAETARALGLDPATIMRCRVAGLVHEVGKLVVPGEILRRRDELTPEEMQTVRKHVEIGAEIVRRIPELGDCALAIRHHHEDWNGSGYPDGLAGAAIPLEARVLGVANAFVAATDDRSHGRALEHAEALTMLRARAGVQFDPDCVTAAIAALEGQHNWDSTLLVRRRVGLASLDADR
jgi:diguanylate cyclase (GGDEF)-like protein/putative nucleotidyltransferase with HDIG domain